MYFEKNNFETNSGECGECAQHGHVHRDGRDFEINSYNLVESVEPGKLDYTVRSLHVIGASMHNWLARLQELKTTANCQHD